MSNLMTFWAWLVSKMRMMICTTWNRAGQTLLTGGPQWDLKCERAGQRCRSGWVKCFGDPPHQWKKCHGACTEENMCFKDLKSLFLNGLFHLQITLLCVHAGWLCHTIRLKWPLLGLQTVSSSRLNWGWGLSGTWRIPLMYVAQLEKCTTWLFVSTVIHMCFFFCWQIEIDKRYSSKLCGLCGNFDGNPKDLMIEGMIS